MAPDKKRKASPPEDDAGYGRTPQEVKPFGGSALATERDWKVLERKLNLKGTGERGDMLDEKWLTRKKVTHVLQFLADALGRGNKALQGPGEEVLTPLDQSYTRWSLPNGEIKHTNSLLGTLEEILGTRLRVLVTENPSTALNLIVNDPMTRRARLAWSILSTA